MVPQTTGYGQGGLKDMEEIAALQGIKLKRAASWRTATR
jgi:hypothetical protein